jgi:hypothetical protein
MGGPSTLFPPGFGYDLRVVYAVWALIVAALYPLCRWYAGVKARPRNWWLGLSLAAVPGTAVARLGGTSVLTFRR